MPVSRIVGPEAWIVLRATHVVGPGRRRGQVFAFEYRAHGCLRRRCQAFLRQCADYTMSLYTPCMHGRAETQCEQQQQKACEWGRGHAEILTGFRVRKNTALLPQVAYKTAFVSGALFHHHIGASCTENKNMQ